MFKTMHTGPALWQKNILKYGDNHPHVSKFAFLNLCLTTKVESSFLFKLLSKLLNSVSKNAVSIEIIPWKFKAIATNTPKSERPG